MLGVLLGRERELAEIGRVIDAARECSGGLVVVDGPAGIGKTRLLEEAARAVSAAGVGVLGARGSRVGARALGLVAGEPPVERFAAVHGLYWLCANRAEDSPLVVAVDDVQWADDPSLAWLGYLARRGGDLRVGLVVGVRS